MSDLIEGAPIEAFTELETLRAESGKLTAPLVLERAADPTSPLHEHFTWDDTEAAQKFRLQQAGALIRKFRIVRPTDDGRVLKVPAYTRITDGRSSEYLPTNEVVTVDSLRDQKRARLMVAMTRLADELRAFDEFTVLADAIDGVLSEAA